MKITKRDIKVFILGFLTCFLLATVWDWDNNVKAFKAGLAGEPNHHVEAGE